MEKINPFMPSSPVSTGMFAGRTDELKTLTKALVQTRAGYPNHFMITGERGIGKSSLMLFMKHLADGSITYRGNKFNFCVVDTDIDANTSPIGLMKKINLGLENKLSKRTKYKKLFNDVLGFLKNIEIAGSSYKEIKEKEELILEKFAYSLARTIKRICNNDDESKTPPYDGLLILIDEANNSSKELQLGVFLKQLIERINRKGVNNFSIGLAGLNDLRNVLLESHESSLRIFPDLPLERLDATDSESVIDMCIKESNRINTQQTKINDDAKSRLVELSEGYPHFIQQFGYSAFEKDNDDIISKTDVTLGAFDDGGALERIGNAYYRNDFYNRIHKDSYRQVLRIMSLNLDGWVKKVEIKAEFKGKNQTLDNAIHTLKRRKIILSKEGVRGVYRLQHKGFAYWIRLFTREEEEE